MTHGVGGGWEFGISTQGEELLPPRSLTFDKAMFIGNVSKQCFLVIESVAHCCCSNDMTLADEYLYTD